MLSFNLEISSKNKIEMENQNESHSNRQHADMLSNPETCKSYGRTDRR